MIRSVASYLMMATAIWLIIYRSNGIGSYSLLEESGVAGEGRIVKIECENHGTFRYRFEVAGREFDSYAHARVLGLGCDSLQTDQKVGVVYLASDPSINVVGDPRKELREKRTFAALSAFFLPTFILWMSARQRRKNVQHAAPS